MKETNLTVDEAVSAKLEALSYEIQARRSVVSEMLAQNMDTDTKACERYQKELVEYPVAYETAKRELQKMYVDGIENAERWNLDFQTRTLTVTVSDET